MYPWEMFTEKYYKTTDKIKILSSLLEKFEKLSPPAQSLLNKLINHYLITKLEALEHCESPIEELLVIALDEITENMTDVYFEPQKEIEVNGHKYRVDILIYYGDILDLESCKKLIVECDGYQFHEKTKAQTIYEKRRDRELMSAGYRVVHFTGSEIWNDPFKCAREIRDMLRTL